MLALYTTSFGRQIDRPITTRCLVEQISSVSCFVVGGDLVRKGEKSKEYPRMRV